MNGKIKSMRAPINGRRRFVAHSCLALGAGSLIGGGYLRAAHAQSSSDGRAVPPDSIVVTLLGTGNPEPDPDRFSAATLVEAGGLRLLFDAGRGAAIRLHQLKVPLGSIETVFISHLHSDHVVGLPDVWLMGFINPVFGNRKGALRVQGPRGTGKMVEHIDQAFQADVQIRIADQKVDPANTKLSVLEFERDGVVFEKNGVKVTAFSVDHGELIKPAFGFRIDYAGRAVLISGDTRFDENLIKHGRGADLVIHEVGEAPEAMKDIPFVKDIMAHHTSAEECGRVFTQINPQMAAYTHLVLMGGPKFPPISEAELVAKTRKTYSGPLVIGDDLTRFVVGQKVSVTRWNRQHGSYSNQ